MEKDTVSISVHGAREHNLQNLCLEIPHHKLIAVTGVSGSGKSSLAVDTIAAEGRRQYLESIPSFARQFAGKVHKPDVDEISGLYPVIIVAQRSAGTSITSTVGTLSELYDHLRLLFARFGKTDRDIQLNRSLFSFNSPLGCCRQCRGLGVGERISVDKLIADPSLTLRQGALVPTLPNGYIMYSQVTIDVLDTVCRKHGFSVDVPWQDLSQDQQNVVLNGSDRIKVLYGKHSLESRLKWTGLKAKPREQGYYKGMIPVMSDILRRDRNRNILRFAESIPCTGCGGRRLKADALSVLWQGKTIADMADMELHVLLGFLRSSTRLSAGEEKICSTMIHDLDLLCSLGTGYLQLSRPAPSLTSGEVQRIRLVNQVNSGLSNVLYVFDEPSIGLHPRDTARLVRMLRGLCAAGNTVVIIEHEPDIIKSADWIIETGPGAGINGGRLLYNGPADRFPQTPVEGGPTPTQAAMKKSQLPVQHRHHRGEEYIVRNCRTRNLTGFDAAFIKGGLNVVTGVPGSGKASLVYGCLVPGLKRAVQVNQAPIGRTPRSNPATYTGLADLIRDLFAREPAAREQGFTKGCFSFNNKGGRCEACKGAGKIQIGMHYLGNVDVVCEMCNGNRFNDDVLQVRYKGLSIADVYTLSINEAAEVFIDESRIYAYLSLLQSLGLGYLKLGQPSTTLSGGEAQRIKLAASLSKNTRHDTWFILDEPTTGLHYQDTLHLIGALRALADQGHTVVCMEYQKQLIEAADRVVDLGPGSGSAGGRLIFQGDPKTFSRCAQSVTARALAEFSVPGEQSSRPKSRDAIHIMGASTHNLKHIDVSIPKHKITVCTGVSGSGKSSLVFDTLFSEARSRFFESLSTYARTFISQSNSAEVEAIENLTPAAAVNRKNLPVSPRSTVGTMTGIYENYRYLFSRCAQAEGFRYSASFFSFNHESGACPECSGLGFLYKADPYALAPDQSLSVLEGAFTSNSVIQYYGNPHSQFVAVLKKAAESEGIDLSVPLAELSETARDLIFYGTGDREWTTVWEFKTRAGGGEKEISGPWKGFCTLVEEEYTRRLHNKKLDVISQMLYDAECPACRGGRLNEAALGVKINGMNIHELSEMSICRTLHWFSGGRFPGIMQNIVKQVFEGIEPALLSMKNLGLGHLSISRRASTLSGGEGQRLRLARLMGSGLTGMTLILDEPTIGLHPDNVERMLKLVRQLRDKGNTIVIIEHDRRVISSADYIIELGPGSGEGGGTVTAQGDYDTFIESARSITAPYLISHRCPQPVERQLKQKAFGVRGVNKHNLTDRDFDFSSGGLIALTGMSGAGKSTLVHHVLAPTLQKKRPVNCAGYYDTARFEQIISVDQKAFYGSTGTVAAYTRLLSLFQKIFAASTGMKKSVLSYTAKEGRCPNCNGTGSIKISMDFMDDVFNICELCHGSRYNAQAASYTLNGMSMPGILGLSIEQCRDYADSLEHRDAAKALRILGVLYDLGLGHLHMGQTTGSLSGGEAQRLKLAMHLVQSSDKRALFLLDEPTSGLHYRDIDGLIHVMNRLAHSGHTVLFIEHNDYLIAAANEVIDMPMDENSECPPKRI